MTEPLRLPGFHFTRTRLSNGLDVIARRDERLPIVAVNLWYHVGSKNEERRQRGFAHLFEHLMFEGSEHFPGDYFKPLQRLGAGVNGSTSADRTNYYVDIPAAHVEMPLAMESDRMGHLLAALDERKLRVQKDVVKNEYRQNYANRPYGMVWQLLAEALYPSDHPYSWMTIGAMEDVEAASLAEVESFFRRFYVPANASLCLVGDIDEDRAIQLAERYFGPIPGGARTGLPWAPHASLNQSRALSLHDRVTLERVYLTWPSVVLFHEDEAALTLLADILTRGKASRLYRKLVVERELVQDVSVYQSSRELAGSFGGHATIRPGRSLDEARSLIDAEIAAIARDGVAEAELARVKNGRLSAFFYALESVGGFGGVADRLNAYNTYLGQPERITTDFERYLAVTSESIANTARRYLVERPRVVLTVHGSRARVTLPPLDRSVAPPSAPAARFRAPVPVALTLGCGLPVWVLPHRGLPVVAGTVVLGGGGGAQLGGSYGLPALTAALMDEGTTSRSSAELADAAESIGASIATGCGWDGAYVSFKCLTPHLETTLDLAVDVLRNPSFPETDFARIRGQTLAALEAARDSAEAQAHRSLLRALFPAGHPYASPIDGEEADITAIVRNDLVSFHHRFHGPSQAAWVVAGDVDPEAVAALLDRMLAGWNGPHAAQPVIARPEPADRPRIVLIDRPGSVQAALRMGHVGLPRLDPDYIDTLVFNQILGGQFTSRLNATLREAKGLTYGVRSHFDARKGAGPFTISTALQADRIGEAVATIREEILALLDDRPPTQAELDDARRSLIEGQARHFETPAALVSRYAGLFLHGLPADHHTRFAERLEAVSLDSLRNAAARQIRPESLVAVVVADAQAVRNALASLDWATLVVHPSLQPT
ncbi:MAG: pitrilysin family protein [Isosphaeraceae bacterium]